MTGKYVDSQVDLIYYKDSPIYYITFVNTFVPITTMHHGSSNMLHVAVTKVP